MSEAGRRRHWLKRGGELIAALFLFFILAGPSHAHRAHVTLTSVTKNPATGNWEFVHAVHYHDALRLLAARGVPDAVQPSSIEGRARIALELERGFRWFAPNGQTLQPKTVGAELSGDNVVVYQELTVAAPVGRYTVESSFMHDVFAEQINNVVIEFEKPYPTLRLSRGKPRASFELR